MLKLGKLTVIIMTVFGIAGAIMAENRRRNHWFWGVACALVPPLVLILSVLPARPKGGVSRKCPQCGAVSDAASPSCPSCGYRYPVELIQCPSCGRYVQKGLKCSECGKQL